MNRLTNLGEFRNEGFDGSDQWTYYVDEFGGSVGVIFLDGPEPRYNPTCRSSHFSAADLRQIADILDGIQK